MVTQKERELKCLNTAIQNCLSQKGDSKRIGKLILCFLASG